jgi:hypothetical protein
MPRSDEIAACYQRPTVGKNCAGLCVDCGLALSLQIVQPSAGLCNNQGPAVGNPLSDSTGSDFALAARLLTKSVQIGVGPLGTREYAPSLQRFVEHSPEIIRDPLDAGGGREEF